MYKIKIGGYNTTKKVNNKNSKELFIMMLLAGSLFGLACMEFVESTYHLALHFIK